MATLEYMDLMDVTNGTTAKPTDAVELAKWKRTDAKARRVLTQGLSDELHDSWMSNVCGDLAQGQINDGELFEREQVSPQSATASVLLHWRHVSNKLLFRALRYPTKVDLNKSEGWVRDFELVRARISSELTDFKG